MIVAKKLECAAHVGEISMSILAKDLILMIVRQEMTLDSERIKRLLTTTEQKQKVQTCSTIKRGWRRFLNNAAAELVRIFKLRGLAFFT